MPFAPYSFCSLSISSCPFFVYLQILLFLQPFFFWCFLISLGTGQEPGAMGCQQTHTHTHTRTHANALINALTHTQTKTVSSQSPQESFITHKSKPQYLFYNSGQHPSITHTNTLETAAGLSVSCACRLPSSPGIMQTLLFPPFRLYINILTRSVCGAKLP